MTSPSTFTDGQVITNFAGTGLNARINVNTVSGNPRIVSGDPTTVVTGGNRTDCRFTLTFLNGTASIRLDNFENLQQGERITLSNPDGNNITIQQSSNNGGGLMQIDGVNAPALNTDVVQDDIAIIREVNNGAGTQWFATMNSITSFTWEYDALSGVSATEGFFLTLLSTTLPIELIDFHAKTTTKNTVMLNWQTASERNNDYFTIERSVDGIDWLEVARVNGSGNSLSLLSYSVIDNNPYAGISYYRLKQTDFDEKYEYSEIKSVEVAPLTNSKILIYPNPTDDIIRIIGDESEIKALKMYDIFGKEITFISLQIVTGDSTLMEIDLSHLNKGVYFIKTKTTINKVYKQ